MTRSLLEALTACVAVFLFFGTFMSLMAGSSGEWQPTMNAGIAWITVTSFVLIMLIGAAVILRMQFFRRRTMFSRYLTGALAVLCILVTLTPWQIGFAIQKSLNLAPGSAAALEMNFNPALGRAKRYEYFPSRGALPFRDFNGLANYPVDASKIQDSRIVIQIYQPTEHFTRKLVIPEIRLGDWEGTQ